MRVKLWGTRGGLPTPEHSSGYGGNTLCVEVMTSGGTRLILDGGTGIHWLGQHMLAAGFAAAPEMAYIFLTCTHWDHIQGLPFFNPLLAPSGHFEILGCGGYRPLEKVLRDQMDRLYCPVPDFFDANIGASLAVRDVGEEELLLGDARVLVRHLNPQGDTARLGYRISDGTTSVAYLPAVEYLEETHRLPALELAHDTDLLLHNAHYTAAEYETQQGQGHTCDTQAYALARRAGAGHLVLLPHHPDRSDQELETVVEAYGTSDFPVEAAREGRQYLLSSSA